MQKIINGFKKLSVNVIFSASIDGAILDDEYRSHNEKITHTPEFYDKVFKKTASRSAYRGRIFVCNIFKHKVLNKLLYNYKKDRYLIYLINSINSNYHI